jgi:zinc D-Ala-D-Ala carboxypeptidase
MPLSPHFDLNEFDQDGPIPDACLPVLTDLCTLVLEPVRERFGELKVTSGYRPPLANAEAHGQPNSEHIYSPAWCACDFLAVGEPIQRTVFDWMRENPSLPYHQLILEHSANGSSIVHVSMNKQKPGVRSVLEGATHNAEPYVKVDHVEYAPDLPPMGVEESSGMS